MNRNEVAAALDVGPWDVDEWLLLGCPARKLRTLWEFDLEKVRAWLEIEKIKIIRIRKQHRPTRRVIDVRWFGERCPICIERGFPGEKAGKVYTMGEMLGREWHLRRTGIPCGHSTFLPPTKA